MKNSNPLSQKSSTTNYMNILTLSIKQVYFDEIKAGKKKTETREIRANTADRYIEYLYKKKRLKAKDVPPDAKDVECVPVAYDQIRFLTGAYNATKRPSMTVEVLGAQINILTDEDDNEIVYEYQGVEYVAAEIVYALGKVLE